MRICDIEGCGNKHLANGLCSSHYQRLYKHERLHLIVRHDLTTVERLQEKITINENGCWIYTGRLTPKGYVHVRHSEEQGKMRFGHVIVWEEAYGPVPEGLELDHTCKNRACLNPDHLEPVTHAINVQRAHS